MLPIQNRLLHRRDFSVVYQCGIRRNAAALGLRAYLRHRNTALPSRVGFSISQKVSKHAVVRNRIKRQLRAAFRQLLPSLRDGWDLIIVVRSEALQCDYPKFLQQLEQLLAQAEILNGN
jgi:ribonuclease P protein component